MKRVYLALLFFSVGARSPVLEVPAGRFLTWGGPKTTSLHFRSDGIEISVTALPCPPKPKDDRGCGAAGVNNQARIVVKAPGQRPFTLTSDPAAELVSIAVGRLDRRASRPGIVVDNQWTGSLGINTIQFLEPEPGGFHAVELRDHTGNTEVAGDIIAFPRDVNGDGIVDVVLEDVAFAYTFGCGACTPRPPMILSVVHGHSVDLSTDPAARPLFARDIARPRAICRSGRDYRNGNCAAYVADAARLGRFKEAWRDMLTHFETGVRGGDLWDGCSDDADPAKRWRTFPEALRAFLVHTGYITAAQAALAASG